MKRTIIACLALASLSITSCKKDKDEAVTPTKENLVGEYTITSVAMSSSMVPGPVDPREACAKDDVYTLSASGVFTIKDAGTKCDPVGDDQGTWSLVSSSKISIDGEEGTIESFNGKTLVVSGTETVGSMTFTVKTTFAKK